mmetsp:Transcript_7760/g.17993  ORF Transcript_7760/g.17993 Transcript_7760/m.17993 type:complete len:665 (+) Transcript_7760:51-2045(+)
MAGRAELRRMDGPAPILKQGSSSQLPPLLDAGTDGLKLLSKIHSSTDENRIHGTIAQMAQSPLKKRLDVGLSASLERVNNNENFEVKDPSAYDYVELEVLMTSRMQDMKNLHCGSKDVGPRAPKQPRASSRSSRRNELPDSSPSPDPKSSSAILQQVREAQVLFAASVREISLQLGIHCPERARLISKTFEYYALLLSKVAPFLDTLDKKTKDAAIAQEALSSDDSFRNRMQSQFETWEHWELKPHTGPKVTTAHWHSSVEATWSKLQQEVTTCTALRAQAAAAEAQLAATVLEADALRKELEQARARCSELDSKVTGLEASVLASQASASVADAARSQRAAEEMALAGKEREEVQAQRLAAEEALRVERETLKASVMAQVGEIHDRLQKEKAELEENLKQERIKAAVATAAKSKLESELAGERAGATARETACSQAYVALRQAVTTLNEAVAGAVPVTALPSTAKEHTAMGVLLLGNAIASGVACVAQTAIKNAAQLEDGDEKLRTANEELAVAKEEIQEFMARVSRLTDALADATKPKPLTIDMGCQATGVRGGGVAHVGCQTWGSRGEDPTEAAAPPQPTDTVPSDAEEIKLPLDQPGKPAPGMEPLSRFMIRYLQRRFGLLEVNAEWELGRLRKVLGRVLDVCIKIKKAGDFDDDEDDNS